MELVPPPDKVDEIWENINQAYEYMCEGRIYKARETLEAILGKTPSNTDLA
jgi:hypothetical protein